MGRYCICSQRKTKQIQYRSSPQFDYRTKVGKLSRCANDIKDPFENIDNHWATIKSTFMSGMLQKDVARLGWVWKRGSGSKIVWSWELCWWLRAEVRATRWSSITTKSTRITPEKMWCDMNVTNRTLSLPRSGNQKLPEIAMISEPYQEFANGRKHFDGPMGDVNGMFLV